MGTHRGAVANDYLDYYLDKFTFRFNRRTSKSRGKLFYRLLQQAVQIAPVPHKEMIQAAGTKNTGHNILWSVESIACPDISTLLRQGAGWWWPSGRGRVTISGAVGIDSFSGARQ
jgi:hypothetical protein